MKEPSGGYGYATRPDPARAGGRMQPAKPALSSTGTRAGAPSGPGASGIPSDGVPQTTVPNRLAGRRVGQTVKSFGVLFEGVDDPNPGNPIVASPRLNEVPDAAPVMPSGWFQEATPQSDATAVWSFSYLFAADQRRYVYFELYPCDDTLGTAFFVLFAVDLVAGTVTATRQGDPIDNPNIDCEFVATPTVVAEGAFFRVSCTFRARLDDPQFVLDLQQLMDDFFIANAVYPSGPRWFMALQEVEVTDLDSLDFYTAIAGYGIKVDDTLPALTDPEFLEYVAP